ncbi:MAG TPA: multifunctional CCA addition/repair protein [Gammaproteobacteria bacterium]|nr:multifunctional CCA addition/repair protein [Gammaproteobacteria bacterium]
MQVYRVGGAVRDRLLGLPVEDRDWVVVGATPEEMRARGFREVGRDFPVFLHPETGEEYALARTERKVAPGYHGFTFHAAPDVTLEEDLRRRDLTINAMAETPDGRLIDPYGGYRDLQGRTLRHVSPAFAEDPLRILRVARFAARLAPLGFHVAEETQALMRRMVEAGEVDALVPERVWKETERALGEAMPEVFIRTLRACGALARLFPEIDRLFGVPQPPQHHPEIDTGIHTLMALDQACRLTTDTRVRFAVLVHDVGKGLTPREEWPRHRGHEARGVMLIEDLCRRLRIPRAYRELACLVCRYHTHSHRAAELRPATLLKTLEAIDALRRPPRLEPFLQACEADARGRQGLEDRPYPQARILRRALTAALSVSPRTLVDQGLQGAALGEALRLRRLEAIARALSRAGEVDD